MAEKFSHQPFKDDPNAVGPEPGDDVSYRARAIGAIGNPEFARLRRNRIAEGFAFALVSSAPYSQTSRDYAVDAVTLADALIAELDK